MSRWELEVGEPTDGQVKNVSGKNGQVNQNQILLCLPMVNELSVSFCNKITACGTNAHLSGAIILLKMFCWKGA